MSSPLFPSRRIIDKATLFTDCRYSPTPPQLVIHDAGPQDAGGRRFRIVSAGVRLGKTHAGAWEIVAAALAPNAYVTEWWCVAPLHSLADRAFNLVATIFTEHFPEHVVKLLATDGVLIVRNLAGHEARIYRRSTERGLVALTGASVDGMVIDEASAVPDDIWESALSTRLLDRLGWVLAISSPRGTGGWWARMLRTGLRGDDRDVFGVCMPTWANPRVSREEIIKAKQRMEGWRFAQDYGGQLVAHSGKVFDPTALEACATGSLADPESGAVYVAGLDLAISNDYSVVVVAKRGKEGLCEVVHVSRFTRLPWDQQVARVKAVVARYNDAQVRVDATGLGNPVLTQIRDAEVQAEGVVLTSQRKNAIVRNLAVILERGRIVVPRRDLVPELYDEVEAFEYLDRDGDLRKMGAPSGGHDDCVVALALCASYFRGGPGGDRACIVGADGTKDEVGRDPMPERPGRKRASAQAQSEPQLFVSGLAVPEEDELVRRPAFTLDELRRRDAGIGLGFAGRRLDPGLRFGGE